jgi:hypothetical protein
MGVWTCGWMLAGVVGEGCAEWREAIAKWVGVWRGDERNRGYGFEL